MPSPLDGLITRQDIADFAANEKLVLDDEDRIGVLEATESIDVQACPGSGKTTLIAAKLILLAKKWPFEDRGICVLSHTNVAKDEIIHRLKKSRTIEAQSLLTYPHFIGTIQEFVGKYVAFPHLRSKGIKIKLVDTDSCVGLIYSRLQRRTRSYIDRRSLHSNILYDFDLKFDDGTVTINVPSFPNGSTSPSYKDLLSTRKSLIAEGCFFYRDVFSIARKAIFENRSLASALQTRFSCVFLDEMQDTQKFQDDLLCEIFPVQNPNLCIQRFGDPDQAIFHGIGSEEPNDSFNGKSTDDMDFVIEKSHRFASGIADKIAKLSFNEIRLQSELSEEHLEERKRLKEDGHEFKNTIFVFDEESISKVVPAFLETVSQQFCDAYIQSEDFTVKIIGAVGKDISANSQLRIANYWPDFDREKSVKNFRESTLIEAVRYCRQRSGLDWVENYKLLLDCVVRLLRSGGIHDANDKYFTVTTLRENLVENGRWETFRECIHLWLNSGYELDQEFWNSSMQALCVTLNLNAQSKQIRDYLAFNDPALNDEDMADEEENGDNGLISLPGNAIQHSKGFRVQLSTIHGVKGETHDATLVLETKNYCYDLGVMLPYITGELPSDAVSNTALRDRADSRRANKQFLRQFYVGMSRPKHLLGLAIHASRISEPQKEALTRIGWKVNDLSQVVE